MFRSAMAEMRKRFDRITFRCRRRNNLPDSPDADTESERILEAPRQPSNVKAMWRMIGNLRRLNRSYRPLKDLMRNLSAIFSWSSMYTSAICFIVYMYAAWHGWTIPMFLFLAILRLSLNYLISRGWRIQWHIIPEPLNPPKEDHLLLFDVAQKIYNLAGIFEKVKNLFMWVRVELTRKIYLGLWVAFMSSCLLPYQLLGFIIGVYVGMKFFIINFILKSFPVLRERFDTLNHLWANLPTDQQLEEPRNTIMNRLIATARARWRS